MHLHLSYITTNVQWKTLQEKKTQMPEFYANYSPSNQS